MKFFFTYILLQTFIFNIGMSQALNERSYIPANSLVYSLPLTKINVKVEIAQEHFESGPYANYADAYLSVNNASTENSIHYSIQNVEMSPIIGADYEAMYMLPLNPKNNNAQINFMTLTNEGLIFAAENVESLTAKARLATDSKNRQAFPDRLPKSPIVSKKTSKNKSQTDTSFKNIPFQQSIVSEMDPERKAAEAAKFIFSLRQRRFELITGDVDNAFSGNSLKDALNEINRLEQEYISLFLGRTVTYRNVLVFSIIPTNIKNKSSHNIFRFSETEGVLDNDAKGGRSITLDISPEERIKNIEGINFEKKTNLIYYRVPEYATIQLMDSGEEICRGDMPIYQMGKTMAIPAEIALQ